MKATTTASYDPWVDWASTTLSTKTVTTSAAGWGSSSSAAATTTTTKAATTTSAAPVSGASCPASNGQTVKAGGSCNADYQVNCGVQGNVVTGVSKFWQESYGTPVLSLAACLTQCDNNDKCQAALWVDDASSADYHLCWQTSGLTSIKGSGVGQLSFKSGGSGCSSSYDS